MNKINQFRVKNIIDDDLNIDFNVNQIYGFIIDHYNNNNFINLIELINMINNLNLLFNKNNKLTKLNLL